MTLSKAALKLLFQTGDIPSQTDFDNFIDSYPNLEDNNQLEGIINPLTGVAPPDQSTAVDNMLFMSRFVSGDPAGSGIKLPLAVAGRMAYSTYNDSVPLYIYPQSGENIHGLVTDLPLIIYSPTDIFWVCITDGRWLPIIQRSDAIDGLYKEYTGQIFQSATAAPTFTTLKNTIGTLVWSYVGGGHYRGTLSGAFTDASKFFAILSATDYTTIITCTRGSANYIDIYTSDNAGLLQNSLLNGNSLTVRMYN